MTAVCRQPHSDSFRKFFNLPTVTPSKYVSSAWGVAALLCIESPINQEEYKLQ